MFSVMQNEVFSAEWMRGVDFYAQKTRANGVLAGTVLIVSRVPTNGRMHAAIMVPAGDRNALPVTTWVDPIRYLARRCVKITAARAAEIHPEMIAYVTKYERSAEFRLMHWHEATRSVPQGGYGPYRERSPLQRAV